MADRHVPTSFRRVAGCIGAWLLAILATLAALELLLRVVDLRELRQDSSERSLAYRHDDELGWVPIPGSDSTVTTARTIHARHNSLGFRDQEFVRDGRPVMLFIGDSFVWGVDAEAGERFTDLLRPRLPQFTLVNAGVSGYGTDQEYLWLQRIWESVRPAVVVLTFCTDNDRWDNASSVRYRRYRKPYFDTAPDGTLVLKGQPVRPSLQSAIRDHALVRQVWLARGAVLAHGEIVAPEIAVPDPTERLVSAVHELVVSRGATLLVAMQSHDERLAAHLTAQGIPFTTFDGAEAYGPQFGSHFTPRGHQLAADRLFDLIGTSLTGSPAAPAR